MNKIPIRQLRPQHHESISSERFKIRRVEDIMGEKDLVQDVHRHDFFFILALKKGRGDHEVDFTPYNVVDHAIFFLRPGQVHRLELKAGCTGYLVEFNTDFYHQKDTSANQRLRKAGSKNYGVPEFERFNKLDYLLEAMLREYIAREEGYLEIINACLDIFCVEWIRQGPNLEGGPTRANTYKQERFEEFTDLLEKNIATHKQVAQYTDLMNLSTYQLNEITKSLIGKTVSALITEQIILEAKRHLLATPGQIKDIADHLGYEDPSYFIRFFKKHTGQSPEAFRKNGK